MFVKARNFLILGLDRIGRIYDKYGQNVLNTTLRLAAETWEGETNSLSANILMGIALIVVSCGDQLREDVFKSHVGAIPIKLLIRNAKERRPGAKGYSEAMILAYNKKSKYHLSISMLYGGKNVPYDPEVDE